MSQKKELPCEFDFGAVQCTYLLHRLLLGRGADPGDGEADVDGGADALVEELRLQEDLAVRDGDDVGRDVGGHVAGLRLDDGQSRQRAAAHRVGHLGSPLKKPNWGQTRIRGVSG